jgi:hypothetical protein
MNLAHPFKSADCTGFSWAERVETSFKAGIE